MAVDKQEVTLAVSAARTATAQFSGPVNDQFNGIDFIIDVTAIAATPSVVFTIQGQDPVSGKWYTILASAAIVGVGTTILRVHPGAVVTANVSANACMPRTWRVDATHADADSITYSLGAVLHL
jgi:hypothetical protein